MIDLDPRADLEAAERRAVAPWPAMRRAILDAGGIRWGTSTDVWDRHGLPGDVAASKRGAGFAYDHLGQVLAEGTGDPQWFDIESETCRAALDAAWADWQSVKRAVQVARPEPKVRPATAAAALKDGRRRFAEHLARLETRHGSRLDMSGIDWRWIDYYESGARLEIHGQRGTVGCTSTVRPTFVFLISIPLEPSEVPE